jgi:flagellar basal-body rod protein FlgG
MFMRALSIAATGMNAQQLNVEVIANNIANINTTAFKRARAEFTDLIYQAERVAGVAQVGLGVRTAAIRNLHLQGALTSTGNPLDLALNGRGWFQITGADGETFFSRAGSFNTNATGQLVTNDGLLVEPTIVIPTNALSVMVSDSGQISVQLSGQVQPQQLGQLTLANFANEAGLEPLGGNLYKQTPASGAPVVGVPGDPGFATVRQGYLESSNVDPVKEITELISAQRAYEMNSKVIQAGDEMSKTITTIR